MTFDDWCATDGAYLKDIDDAARAARLMARRAWDAAAAAERERWQRIATNAQAVTNGGEDKLDYFEVPSHLMAALALALDEGPNA